MGRVIQVHERSDFLVRVVSVETRNGVLFKRAITKICVLPMSEIEFTSESIN